MVLPSWSRNSYWEVLEEKVEARLPRSVNLNAEYTLESHGAFMENADASASSLGIQI